MATKLRRVVIDDTVPTNGRVIIDDDNTLEEMIEAAQGETFTPEEAAEIEARLFAPIKAEHDARRSLKRKRIWWTVGMFFLYICWCNNQVSASIYTAILIIVVIWRVGKKEQRRKREEAINNG